MSDDDLWRPQPPADDSSRDQVTDETQPLTGGAPTPSAPPPGPGSVPPPTNPYPQPVQPNPYGAPGPQAQQGPHAGGPGYLPPPNPYPAPHEYAPPQNPYGVPFQPAYAGGTVPDHPSATTAMVLGIISLVGIAFCGGLTLILSPAAWVVGAKAVRQIDASPGQFAGRDRAQAGKIMGIIGSVLLVLGIVAIIAFVALVVSFGTSDPQPAFPSPSFQNGGA